MVLKSEKKVKNGNVISRIYIFGIYKQRCKFPSYKYLIQLKSVFIPFTFVLNKKHHSSFSVYILIVSFIFEITIECSISCYLCLYLRTFIIPLTRGHGIYYVSYQKQSIFLDFSKDIYHLSLNIERILITVLKVELRD
jgi:hypothetical protein